MKRPIRTFARAIFAALAVVLAGFVFGGGGATGTGYIANGTLSGFGSIFVNDIEFFTDQANISINGVQNRPESDLRIGMVLTVDGSLGGSGTTGTASTVVYQANALGLIDRAPTPDGAGGFEFGVLGQSISIESRTIFAGFLSPTDLQVGDYVEVSGFPSETGVLASRIERKSSGPNVQVQGVVANLTGNTFTVGALTVDYTIAQISNMPPGGLANGIAVVAGGPTPVNGVLQATSIQGASQNLQGASNASITGLVANYVPGSSMTVNGQFMLIASDTQFANGSAADLADGSFVKADVMVYNGGSTVVATKITFSVLNAPSNVESDVTATGASSFELLGPGGVTITANSQTQWHDQTNKVNAMTFSDLQLGDHIQVQGNQVSDGVILATSITRTQPASAIVVYGRGLSVAQPDFGIFDVTFTTNDATDFGFQNGNPISPATWFQQAAGHNILATVTRTADGQLLVTSARIQ